MLCATGSRLNQCCVVRRVGWPSTGVGIERDQAGKAVAQTEIPADLAVHLRSVAAKSEEGEDHEAHDKWDVAVEEHLTVRGILLDHVPVRPVDLAPGVRVPGHGDCQVVVNDVSLGGEDGDEGDGGETEESQEAGLAQVASGGMQDEFEVVSVLANPMEDKAWISISFLFGRLTSKVERKK